MPIPGLRGAVPSLGVLVLLQRWEQWVWAGNVSPQMAVMFSYLIFVSVTVKEMWREKTLPTATVPTVPTLGNLKGIL